MNVGVCVRKYKQMTKFATYVSKPIALSAHLCLFVCACVCVYIYIYVCVYLCMYVCMYMYVCIYGCFSLPACVCLTVTESPVSSA